MPSPKTLSDILNKIADPVFVKDSDHCWVFLNDAYCRFMGYPREQLIGKTDRDYFPQQESDVFWAKDDSVFKTGREDVNEERFTDARGAVHTIVTHKALYVDEAGRKFIVGIIHDMTLSKNMETRLKETNVFLDSIVENIPNMIFVKEAKELRFVRFNRAGQELIGIPRNDMMGKNDYDFFPKEQADFFTRKDREVLAAGKVVDIPEEPLQTARRGVRILHTKKIPILDEKGQPSYLLGISEDITEQKAAREKIQQLNVELEKRVSERTAEIEAANAELRKEISERKKIEADLQQRNIELEKANLELDSFVYTASHDLRAPLRSVGSFADILEANYKDVLDDQGRDYLQRIRSSARRLNALIQDLLVLSRVSRGPRHLEAAAVTDMVRTALERSEFDLEKAKINIRIQENMPVVHCDRIKITEVFLNLINNAIKFSYRKNQDKTLVEVGYREDGGMHLFFVRDNGIGIDPKYQDKIFDIFTRLHTAEEYSGTGAGLNIAQRIISDAGGKIWVESQPGKGAVFYFTIPKTTDNTR